jgi:hypothetical protein
MSTKRIVGLGFLALLLYFAFLFGLRAAFPRTAVGYDTPVTGRVSGYFLSQRQRSFYLNGLTTTRYNFDSFAPVRPAEAPAVAKGNPEESRSRLDGYLRKGDYIRKAAHAATLTVHRGDSLTLWAFSPAE